MYIVYLIVNKPILVTGAAGFIGSALCKKLLLEGENVVGLDNLSNYYDVNLKINRLKDIENISAESKGFWHFKEISLEDYVSIKKLFDEYSPSIVINLAAQAGVRYSIEDPFSYVKSNLEGFTNILECCRKNKIENFIYASSSSVYGGNKNLPFKEDDQVNHPLSLYAATKKSNELLAHSYSNLYNIPSTGLRFFTVYGPWGRPDMAPMIFARAILEKKPIPVFNYGNVRRDFTYIDDIVEGIYRCCYKPATINHNFDYQNPVASSSFAPHRIFNIGNNTSIEILYFIKLLEDAIGIKAIIEYKSMQLGDVKETKANTDLLKLWVDFKPYTSIETGVKLFINWFLDYYKNS